MCKIRCHRQRHRHGGPLARENVQQQSPPLGDPFYCEIPLDTIENENTSL